MSSFDAPNSGIAPVPLLVFGSLCHQLCWAGGLPCFGADLGPMLLGLPSQSGRPSSCVDRGLELCTQLG